MNIDKKMREKKLFFKNTKIENGETINRYYQICKGYIAKDQTTGMRVIVNAKCKRCKLEKVGEDIVPIDNFINKEFKYIDSFKLVPEGTIGRGSISIYENVLCEEIIYIDQKQNI
jgi:hypothetical protein